MTLATENNKIVYTANGVNDTFAYNFKIFSQTDLVVYEDNVETVLAYTVSGVGDASGGDVVFTSTVPPDGTLVTLIRETPYTQGTDYTAYGPFPAETHEDTLDKMVILVQQLREEVDRCIRLPKWNENDPVEVDMATDEDVTSKLIGYNALGELALRAVTVVTPGIDLDMDGDDIILNSGIILAKNNENIISGRNAADNAYLPVLKVNANDDLELTQDLQLANGTTIDEFSTDVTLAGDSDDAVPTEKAAKTYIDARDVTYGSLVDLANGGADDLDEVSLDVAALVAAGITDFELMLTDVSTDAANEILHVTLGSDGGEETSLYAGEVNYITTAAVVGAAMATTSFQLIAGTLFDAAVIIPHMNIHLRKITSAVPGVVWSLEAKATQANVMYQAFGYKTMTGNYLEDIIFKTGGGNFDGGALYLRYWK